MPSATFLLGTQLKEPVYPYRQVQVFGAELNAPNADGWGGIPIVSGGTTFNLANTTPNHEICVACLGITNSHEGSYHIQIRWYDVDRANILFTWDWDWSTGEGEWFYVYSYIGWVPWEISHNGRYRVEVDVTGDWTKSAAVNFNVIGIPAEEEEEEEEKPEEPEEPVSGWHEAILVAIFKVAGFFGDLAERVGGWISPFNWLAGPFSWIHDQFFNFGVSMGKFLTWVRDIAAAIGGGLGWDDIWQLILSHVPWLQTIADWFSNWVSHIRSAISDWWGSVQVQVKLWIELAVQWIRDAVKDWVNFWDNIWPQVTRWVDELRAGWDHFIKETLPQLPGWGDIDDFFNSKLKELQGLWDGWQEMKDKVVEFFQNPVEFIWNLFADWFLGPED